MCGTSFFLLCKGSSAKGLFFHQCITVSLALVKVLVVIAGAGICAHIPSVF
jgi:hypothetical protein